MIKREIFVLTTHFAGYPVSLHYGGKVLRDNLPLAEYNVQRGSTIFARDAAPAPGNHHVTHDEGHTIGKRKSDNEFTTYPKRKQKYAAGLLLGGSLDV